MSNFVERLNELAKKTREAQSSAERRRADSTLFQVSEQLKDIGKKVSDDAERDANGGDSGSDYVRGFLIYVLDGIAADERDSEATKSRIVATDGYGELQSVCETLGLKVEINGVAREADDFHDYEGTLVGFCVTVSGWGRSS